MPVLMFDPDANATPTKQPVYVWSSVWNRLGEPGVFALSVDQDDYRYSSANWWPRGELAGVTALAGLDRPTIDNGVLYRDVFVVRAGVGSYSW